MPDQLSGPPLLLRAGRAPGDPHWKSRGRPGTPTSVGTLGPADFSPPAANDGLASGAPQPRTSSRARHTGLPMRFT